MELVREICRLKWSGNKSDRIVGRILKVSKTTVKTHYTRVIAAGINSWERLEALDDDELKKIIFPWRFSPEKYTIDFGRISKELRRKNMTLMLLWEEEQDKGTLLPGYSQFCGLFREWKKKQKITMRQFHKFGEKGFVDYAGTTVPVVDRGTGESKAAQIFDVPRCQPIHFCGGDMDTGDGGLPRQPCQGIRIFRGCFPRCWYRIISSRGSIWQASTSRNSTSHTGKCASITLRRPFRPGCANRRMTIVSKVFYDCEIINQGSIMAEKKSLMEEIQQVIKELGQESKKTEAGRRRGALQDLAKENKKTEAALQDLKKFSKEISADNKKRTDKLEKWSTLH